MVNVKHACWVYGGAVPAQRAFETVPMKNSETQTQ